MASENVLLSLRGGPSDRSEPGRKAAVGNRSESAGTLNRIIPVKLPSGNGNESDNSPRCLRGFRANVLVCRGEAVGLVPARMYLYIGGTPRQFVCFL